MKNPFVKEHSSVLIGSIIAGAAVTGVVIYLFLTEKGAEARESIIHKVKDFAKDSAADYVSIKTRIPKKALKKVADHLIK